MNLTQIIGLAGGIFTASSLLPQVIKTMKEKKAENISMIMLIILLGGLILWIIYGFMRNDLPIIITNCFSLVINIIMMFLRIKYKNR